MKSKGRHQRGFSVVEVVVVLALIALLMGLTMSIGSWFARFLVQREIHKFQTLCYYVQAHAVATGHEEMIRLDRHKQGYWYHETFHALPPGIAYAIMPRIAYGPGQRAYHRHNPISYVNDTIHFYPDGTIQAGTLYMSDRTTQYALTTNVGAISYIRIYYYDPVLQNWTLMP